MKKLNFKNGSSITFTKEERSEGLDIHLESDYEDRYFMDDTDTDGNVIDEDDEDDEDLDDEDDDIDETLDDLEDEDDFEDDEEDEED